MANFVHILKIGNYNRLKEEYQFYDMDVFSSRRKLVKAIENHITTNGGYNIAWNHKDMISYECLSTDSNVMKIRYLIIKKVVN